MTLNGVMADILLYFTEFGSLRGPLRKTVKVVELTINRVSPEKYQLSMTKALCFSR